MTPASASAGWQRQGRGHAQVDEQPQPLLAKRCPEHDGEDGHGHEQGEALGPPLVGHPGQDPEQPQVSGGKGR